MARHGGQRSTTRGTAPGLTEPQRLDSPNRWAQQTLRAHMACIVPKWQCNSTATPRSPLPRTLNTTENLAFDAASRQANRLCPLPPYSIAHPFQSRVSLMTSRQLGPSNHQRRHETKRQTDGMAGSWIATISVLAATPARTAAWWRRWGDSSSLTDSLTTIELFVSLFPLHAFVSHQFHHDQKKRPLWDQHCQTAKWGPASQSPSLEPPAVVVPNCDATRAETGHLDSDFGNWHLLQSQNLQPIFNPGTLPAKTSRRFRETTPERRRPALPGRPRPSVAAPPPRAIGCRPMESRRPLGRDDGGLIITIVPPHRRQSSRVWPQTDLLPQLLTDRQNTRCCDVGPAALRTPTIHLHATSAVIGPPPLRTVRDLHCRRAPTLLERELTRHNRPRGGDPPAHMGPKAQRNVAAKGVR